VGDSEKDSSSDASSSDGEYYKNKPREEDPDHPDSIPEIMDARPLCAGEKRISNLILTTLIDIFRFRSYYSVKNS
jgi:hypothetical protein